MWTPKRILLLTLGFAVFLTAYFGYGRALGRIDGLPPLPEKYWPINEVVHPPPPGPQTPLPPPILAKLQQAFGPGCDETGWPIKLEVRSKGIVLAAKDFHIDGQKVTLKPLSMALFGKANGGPIPEINTIRAGNAELIFDGPVTNPLEMGKRKILQAELSQGVLLTNNRRTLPRDDDISLSIPHGTVSYLESQHHIWTEAPVEMRDEQSKPQPMTATATGMDVFLVPDNHAARQGQPPPARKAHSEGITGVERVVLRSSVRMDLYADGGFLAGGKGDKKSEGNGEPKKERLSDPVIGVAAGLAVAGANLPPEKSRVVITTYGPFVYDVERDRARFDIPAAGPTSPNQLPEQVQVTRFAPQDKKDTLDCEHLELQFGRKKPVNNAPAADADEHGMNREIESVHATGKVVFLRSQSENLDAKGNDFTYDARTRLSILRGDPQEGMWAMKEGDEIYARELQLTDHKENGVEVLALGPGRIQAFDKQSGKRILIATWKDRLVSRKDEGRDLLILTQEVTFLDPQSEPPQQMRGDMVKVWLEPNTAKNRKDPAVAANQPGDPSHPRLQQLEAIGHVLCSSKEMNVHDSERLVVHFEDVPPASALPGTSAVAPAPPAPELRIDGPIPMPGVKPGAAADSQPPRPIDLQARLVTARIARSGTKNELAKLWTEGDVHVRQQGATPQERGVDITGETLELTRKPEGSILVVTGDLAQLSMNQVLIMGPAVNIDQTRNYAWVDGKGAMRMESNRNLQGEETANQVPLWVYWNERMVFDGQFPDFYGDVEAYQGDTQMPEQPKSRLLCQHLQVAFDRRVSFKEGEKSGQQPKVQHMVCSQDVHVEEVTWQAGKLVKYQRIDCPTLNVNNENNTMKAPGFGVVRLLQPGSEDPLQLPGNKQTVPTQPPARQEEVLKLTRVRYAGRMWGDNKKRLVTFTDNVEVYHLPANSPDVEIDPLHLPAGCLYMRCNRLEVLGNQPGTRAKQEMTATGRVTVFSQEFSAEADTVSFNEEKDQIIFEGGEAGDAVLYRYRGKGLPPDVSRGKKFIYYRKTGQIKGDTIRSIEGRN